MKIKDFIKEQNINHNLTEQQLNYDIVFLAIAGSHAYGTNTPESDVDYRGIFIQPLNEIIGLSHNYIPQISIGELDSKGVMKQDIVFYEIGRFTELLIKSNPNTLEMLNFPDDVIQYCHPLFTELFITNRDKFLTKECKKSITGYAISQIKKSKGQNKKQNWEKNKISRLTPLHFCDVFEGNKSIPLTEWLNKNNLNQENCGLSLITTHTKNDKEVQQYLESTGIQVFAIHYNPNNTYNGIIKETIHKEVISHQLRHSSIPINEPVLGYVRYNMNAYSKHCKDYASYQTWLKERNVQRWIDVENHQQKIDGKNLMHCVRLIDMSIEMATEYKLNVRRSNPQKYLDIRKGKIPLDKLLENVESQIKNIDELFEKSTLHDTIDLIYLNSLLIQFRTNFYL